MNEEMRVCSKCGVEQPIERYRLHNHRRDGECKSCRSKKSNAKNRDDWPPMPEIMKNKYWVVTK